jgi:hypothetical protein
MATDVTPVSGVVITPEMAKSIAEATETKQLEMATNVCRTLVETLDSDLFGNGLKYISPLDLLDVLGICGLSLTIGEWASWTYLTELEKVGQ